MTAFPLPPETRTELLSTRADNPNTLTSFIPVDPWLKRAVQSTQKNYFLPALTFVVMVRVTSARSL